MGPKLGIALIGTLDTKGAEIEYVRDRLAKLGTRPVVIASPAVNTMNRLSPTGITSATVAADSAAVADIGPHTRWRELPSAAYRISAPGAA